jgi:alpha-1,2-mannosyltransferase
VLAPEHHATSQAAASPQPMAGDPAGRPHLSGQPGSRLLLAGAAGLTAALALYAAVIATHPAGIVLRWFDLRVYLQAGLAARHAPATLYDWQSAPGIRFTYTPFAAAVFAGLSWLPWPAVTWPMLAVSVLAVTATAWLALRGLGWQGRRRAGAALAITAVALWTEPVQRALHLGQVELVLMALAAADLSGPGRRWWRGIGIGVAAGIKLVPLIFLPYLAATRRWRQAAVAAATFAATAGLGAAMLPQASAQWWLGPAFLRPGRTGFVPFVANQSLRALAARTAGSLAASGGAWLAAAVVTGAAGLAAAAILHRTGRPVAGWVTCALTGLLVSPVSWDHHWVWLVPGLAVLVDLAARARGMARWAWWGLAGLLAGIFGAWPGLWFPGGPLLPSGLIWYAPGSGAAAGSHPEYHWHGLTWLAGNAYLLTGLALLAGVAAAAARCQRRTGPVPRARTGNWRRARQVRVHSGYDPECERREGSHGHQDGETPGPARAGAG